MTTTTTATSAAALERKAAAFVEQFAVALLPQWISAPAAARVVVGDRERLTAILEEGIAKLPPIAVKGHLRRDIARFVGILAEQLAANLPQEDTTTSAAAAGPELLNEEDVERALARLREMDHDDRAHQAQDGPVATIRSVLTLDDDQLAQEATEVLATSTPAPTAEDAIVLTERLARQLSTLEARRADDDDSRRKKAALFLQLIGRCAALAMSAWASQDGGRWIATGHAPSEPRERLRVLLQSLVARELVLHNNHRQSDEGCPSSWTAFYRPPLGAVFNETVTLEAARAELFASLLGLVLAFPVIADSDSDNDSDDSSSDSDSDEDTKNRKTASGKASMAIPDGVALAKHVTRQVVLAAAAFGPRDEPSSRVRWFHAVLQRFHRLPRPTTVVVDDDDDEPLHPDQQRALDECLGDLYCRAFTGSAALLWPALMRQCDGVGLLEALLCLRHASAFFAGPSRPRTPAALTSAVTETVGIALPEALWRYMARVKKLYAGEHAVVQRVMKTLTRNKTARKMANVLLNDSTLKREEFRTFIEQFELFLATEREQEHFVVARHEPTHSDDPTAVATTSEDPSSALFFVDADGGQAKQKKRTSATGPAIATSADPKRQRMDTDAKES